MIVYRLYNGKIWSELRKELILLNFIKHYMKSVANCNVKGRRTAKNCVDEGGQVLLSSVLGTYVFIIINYIFIHFKRIRC